MKKSWVSVLFLVGAMTFSCSSVDGNADFAGNPANKDVNFNFFVDGPSSQDPFQVDEVNVVEIEMCVIQLGVLFEENVEANSKDAFSRLLVDPPRLISFRSAVSQTTPLGSSFSLPESLVLRNPFFVAGPWCGERHSIQVTRIFMNGVRTNVYDAEFQTLKVEGEVNLSSTDELFVNVSPLVSFFFDPNAKINDFFDNQSLFLSSRIESEDGGDQNDADGGLGTTSATSPSGG